MDTMRRPRDTSIRTMIADARVYCPKNPRGVLYGETGIAYTIPHLEMVYRKFKAHKFTIQQMANYVDIIAMAFYDYLASTTETPDGKVDTKLFDATSIGNIAYVALHATKKEDRERFFSYFNRCR